MVSKPALEAKSKLKCSWDDSVQSVANLNIQDRRAVSYRGAKVYQLTPLASTESQS